MWRVAGNCLCGGVTAPALNIRSNRDGVVTQWRGNGVAVCVSPARPS